MVESNQLPATSYQLPAASYAARMIIALAEATHTDYQETLLVAALVVAGVALLIGFVTTLIITPSGDH